MSSVHNLGCEFFHFPFDPAAVCGLLGQDAGIIEWDLMTRSVPYFSTNPAEYHSGVH
jgi:hypothetical protein